MPSSAPQLESKNCTRYDFGSHETGLSYTLIKGNALSDAGIEHLICTEGGLSDENECTWLSSGGTPTSYLSSDELRSLDNLEIDFCDSRLYYDQSNTVIPVPPGHGLFLLDKAERNSVYDLTACPGLLRLQDGGNGGGFSSQQPCEAMESASDASASPFEMHDEPSPSQGDHGFHRSETSASLLDLEDDDDSNWDRDGYEDLDPDFPSPSYRIRGNIRTRSPSLLGGARGSSASPGSIFQLSPRRAPDGEEPLFWPFNPKSYSEFEGNYLGISPRASMLRIKRRSSSKSVQIRVHKSSQDIHRGLGGRITISSRSARPALTDRKAKDSCSQVSRTGRGASRLGRSSAQSTAGSAGSGPKKAGRSRHQLNSVRKKPGVNQKASLVQCLLEFEAGYFQIYLAGGMPIEALVGLEEFDGREGAGKMTTPMAL